jgi:hypothetical protein
MVSWNISWVGIWEMGNEPKSGGGVFGIPTAAWSTFESTWAGTPHAHILLWMKGFPNTEEKMMQIIEKECSYLIIEYAEQLFGNNFIPPAKELRCPYCMCENSDNGTTTLEGYKYCGKAYMFTNAKNLDLPYTTTCSKCKKIWTSTHVLRAHVINKLDLPSFSIALCDDLVKFEAWAHKYLAEHRATDVNFDSLLKEYFLLRVLLFQDHRHTKSCDRKRDLDRLVELVLLLCRFFFPKEPVEESHFGNDGELLLRRGPFEEFINQTTSTLNLIADNSDTRVIAGRRVVVTTMYLTSYSTKSIPSRSDISKMMTLFAIRSARLLLEQSQVLDDAPKRTAFSKAISALVTLSHALANGDMISLPLVGIALTNNMQMYWCTHDFTHFPVLQLARQIRGMDLYCKLSTLQVEGEDAPIDDDSSEAQIAGQPQPKSFYFNNAANKYRYRPPSAAALSPLNYNLQCYLSRVSTSVALNDSEKPQIGHPGRLHFRLSVRRKLNTLLEIGCNLTIPTPGKRVFLHSLTPKEKTTRFTPVNTNTCPHCGGPEVTPWLVEYTSKFSPPPPPSSSSNDEDVLFSDFFQSGETNQPLEEIEMLVPPLYSPPFATPSPTSDVNNNSALNGEPIDVLDLDKVFENIIKSEYENMIDDEDGDYVINNGNEVDDDNDQEDDLVEDERLHEGGVFDGLDQCDIAGLIIASALGILSNDENGDISIKGQTKCPGETYWDIGNNVAKLASTGEQLFVYQWCSLNAKKDNLFDTNKINNERQQAQQHLQQLGIDMSAGITDNDPDHSEETVGRENSNILDQVVVSEYLTAMEELSRLKGDSASKFGVIDSNVNKHHISSKELTILDDSQMTAAEYVKYYDQLRKKEVPIAASNSIVLSSVIIPASVEVINNHSSLKIQNLVVRCGLQGEQIEIFNLIAHHVVNRLGYDYMKNPSFVPKDSISFYNQPLLHISVGVAGAGKSTIINAIRLLFHMLNHDDYFVVLAPTGPTAANIQGDTIAKAVGQQFFRRNQQSEINAIKSYITSPSNTCLILDEVYMTDAPIFGRLVHLTKVISSSNKFNFGDLPEVILFGDPCQNGPVTGSVVYSIGDGGKNNKKREDSTVGYNGYLSFNSSITLKTTRRTTSEELILLWSAVREGKWTQQIVDLINKKVVDVDKKMFISTPITLVATNKHRVEINYQVRKIVIENNDDEFVIHWLGKGVDPAKVALLLNLANTSPEILKALPEMFVWKDMFVLITKNLAPAVGVANNALATIIDFIWRKTTTFTTFSKFDKLIRHASEPPEFVKVQLYNNTVDIGQGPGIRLIPLMHFKGHFEFDNLGKIEKGYFPPNKRVPNKPADNEFNFWAPCIREGSACTIHAFQGITYDKPLIVSTFASETTASMNLLELFYTGITRVKHFNLLFFTNSVDLNYMKTKFKLRPRIKLELERLLKLEIATKAKFYSLGSSDIDNTAAATTIPTISNIITTKPFIPITTTTSSTTNATSKRIKTTTNTTTSSTTSISTTTTTSRPSLAIPRQQQQQNDVLFHFTNVAYYDQAIGPQLQLINREEKFILQNPCDWLNGNIINYWISNVILFGDLHLRKSRYGRVDCEVYGPEVTLYMNEPLKHVANTKRFIVFVFHNHNHFILIVRDNGLRTLRYVDSLQTDLSEGIITQVFGNIRGDVIDNVAAIRQRPIQPDGNQCGLYALYFLETFLSMIDGTTVENTPFGTTFNFHLARTILLSKFELDERKYAQMQQDDEII